MELLSVGRPTQWAVQLEKWWVRQVPWPSHVGDVSHCGTHHTHMNAAGTKRTPPDPRRNKKEADGAGSTHFDRLEKSGHLVRKKWFCRSGQADLETEEKLKLVQNKSANP